MSKQKEIFIDYCKNKIEDLKKVTYSNLDNETETKKVLMEAEGVRQFKNVKIVTDEDGLFKVIQNNKLVIDTLMIDPIIYAARMEFNKIDKDFYNELIELWNDYGMDELIEEE